MAQRFFFHAAVNGFLVVALGAFGAHGLKDVLTATALETYRTGVQYHMFHVVALFGAGLLCHLYPGSRSFVRSGFSFLAGIILFSGSLYLLALTGFTPFAYVTPFGGVAFLLGWSFMVHGLFSTRSSSL